MSKHSSFNLLVPLPDLPSARHHYHISRPPYHPDLTDRVTTIKKIAVPNVLIVLLTRVLHPPPPVSIVPNVPIVQPLSFKFASPCSGQAFR